METMRSQYIQRPEPRSQNRPAGDLTPEGETIPPEPRSWLSRASDEVAAWLGDVDAAGRRQRDKAAGDHTGQGPNTYVDSDAHIRGEVNQRLTFDPQLDASNIKVEVLAGAVTLDGSVATSLERRRAEDIAMAVPGVSQVSNRLTIV
jgi:osmotically-inducible protein OsmY